MIDDCVVLNPSHRVGGNRAWKLVLLNRNGDLRPYPPYVKELIVR
jgi:hypothetical protein